MGWSFFFKVQNRGGAFLSFLEKGGEKRVGSPQESNTAENSR